ncbi:hypothetical protein RF11_14320 [Thelohanellus kitauei]|uniref:Androgen-dependent TFPI-regulating protein n=1 Tax=Thelohanellus kitauei TaxID=669202 RepID=A0A0C2MK56_THEKT|nr:hypothetical protein RF11_14320 [Thelohanellus kitauei]
MVYLAADTTFDRSKHKLADAMPTIPRIMYFTIFSMYQNALFLTVSVIIDVFKRRSSRHAEIRDNWFFSSVLPCSGLVCILFWAFTFVDRCSVLPCWVQKDFLPLSSFTNHFLHTYQLIFAFSFIPLCRPRMASNASLIKAYTSVVMVYFSILYSFFLIHGQLPYPILERMTFPQMFLLYLMSYIFGLEVFKPAPVHYCTDFTSTAIATVSTYGRDIRRIGTLFQAVRVVLGSHPLNIHPYPLPTRAKLPNRHSFPGK